MGKPIGLQSFGSLCNHYLKDRSRPDFCGLSENLEAHGPLTGLVMDWT